MARAWKFGGGALLIVLGVVLALWTVGSVMPEEHVATCVALIAGGDAELLAAWERIAQPATHAEWRSDVREIQPIDARGTHDFRYVEVGSQGAIEYGLSLVEPPHRAASQILTEGLPYDGGWVFDLDHAEGYVRIEITERGSVYSPVFRVLGRYVFGYTTSMETYLTDLLAALEKPGDLECEVAE